MKTIFKIMLTLTFLITLIGFTSCEKEEPIQTYYITIKPEDWTINQNTAKCKITEFTTIDFNIVKKLCFDYDSSDHTIELFTDYGWKLPNDYYIASFNRILYDSYPFNEYNFTCQLNTVKDFIINEPITVKIITKP